MVGGGGGKSQVITTNTVGAGVWFQSCCYNILPIMSIFNQKAVIHTKEH